MNALRVWGGGVYEQDIFYTLCDMYGIMVKPCHITSSACNMHWKRSRCDWFCYSVSLMSDMAGLYVCLCVVPNREGIYTDSEDGGYTAGLHNMLYL